MKSGVGLSSKIRLHTDFTKSWGMNSDENLNQEDISSISVTARLLLKSGWIMFHGEHDKED
jgi:hypothetical protein